MARPRVVETVPANRGSSALSASEGRDLLASAREHWFSGDFDRSLELAASAAKAGAVFRSEAALLRARVYLRRYQNDLAAEELQSVKNLSDADERATRDMLFGAALHRMENSEGWKLLRAAASEAKHAAVRSESALFMAQAHWAEGALHDAESLLERSLDPDTGIIYARGLELLGWIEDRRERYGVATRHFLDSLSAVHAAPQDDAYMRAGLVQILGSYAVAIPDLRLGRTVQRETEALPRTSGLSSRRFFVDHNLGMLALLEGDLTRAWELFDQTLFSAGTDDRRAIAHTTLATMTLAAGEIAAARRHVGAALRAVRAHDWSASNPDDRNAPLDLAIVAAPIDELGSRAAYEEYRRMNPAPNIAMALERDRRVEALVFEADGTSALAVGKRDGLSALRRAEDLWRELGLRHYEARAALTRYRATGAVDALETARRCLHAAPAAWLNARIYSPATAPKAEALTPAEHRIMMAICEGKSAAAIAATFGRSTHTVRNQTRKVFKVMEVQSRAQLVAECARLGLLGSGREGGDRR
jgi:DNA-binding CsgD family transcriptional regulator